MIDETFLTTEEVLEYLQVNLRTVYRLIKAGKIPAVRVGRQWRFRKRDIDAGARKQPPPGPPPARGCWSERTNPAFAICCRRRWRSPSTTSTRRPTGPQRWIACAPTRTT